MELKLFTAWDRGYESNAQIARVLTEAWVKSNIYCPSCGFDILEQFVNNKPVADFLCNNCKGEYELKSKKNAFSKKVVDGAYASMIKRINSDNNPHFFLLNYSSNTFNILNFLVIPKHFFSNSIIEQSKPSAISAKRAGWVVCNILLNNIPSSGKIHTVKEGQLQDKKAVLEAWAKTSFLSFHKKENRGWIIEILNILDRISNNSFLLKDVYAFESELKQKFPNNNFIKDKIRQQLPISRDRGLIDFKGNGSYVKLI